MHEEKTLTVMLLALAAAGCLAACGQERSAVATDSVSTPAAVETAQPEQSRSPEVTPEPTVEPTPEPVDPNSAIVPDLSTYMGRTASHLHSGNATHKQIGHLPADIFDVLTAELLALLDQDRYQLELINVREIEDDAYHSWNYEYAYTGSNPDVEPHRKGDVEYAYHVKFSIGFYKKSEAFNVSLYYTDGFTPEDPGIRPSVDIPGGYSGSSGSGSSSGGGNVAEFAKKDCFTCHGSGDCPSCNGYGYYKKDGIKHDCTRCSHGKCPSCGGSGKRD